MASPQKENGYAPIANEILEAISKCKLNGTQFRILTTVWRYTYGFSRKQHELSVTFISNATEITKRRIQKELNDLIEKNILTEVRGASFNQTRIIEFNKNYDQWIIGTSPNKKHQVTNETPDVEKDTSPDVEKDTSPDVEKDTSTGDQKDTQESNIKTIYKTNIKTSSSGNDDEQEVFKFYQLNLQRGISESPYVIENIEMWIKDLSPDLVLAAMKVAAKEEKKGFNYTEGILKKWFEAGVVDLEGARRFETEFKSQNKSQQRTWNKPNSVPRAFQSLKDWADEG